MIPSPPSKLGCRFVLLHGEGYTTNPHCCLAPPNLPHTALYSRNRVRREMEDGSRHCCCRLSLKTMEASLGLRTSPRANATARRSQTLEESHGCCPSLEKFRTWETITV
nr:hypothetical protein Itr_chr07CG10320 [Ipomoea trifida]